MGRGDDLGLRELVRMALAEDLGEAGDVTSAVFIAEGTRACAEIRARQPLVVAGIGAAAEVFKAVDGRLEVSLLARDGDALAAGAPVLSVRGSAHAILAAERTALNFVQHLSGVATLTRKFVEAVAHTKARILDTRKTLPGWRGLQKAAVRAGGGCNHRLGLYDRALVKDNHLAALRAAAGSPEELARLVGERIAAFRARHPGLLVEMEADTVEEALAWFGLPGVAIVLLDNMSLEELRICVRRRPEGVLLEASGGITLANAASIAETGVDFLSIGALTHSAPAADLGLDFC